MKHTFDFKLDIVFQVKSGTPIKYLSLSYHIHESIILEWVRKYDLFGESGLAKQPNIRATSEIKEAIVRQVIEKINIFASGRSSIWRKSYCHRELGKISENKRIFDSLSTVDDPLYMGRPKKREPETELEKHQAENTRMRFITD